VWEDDEVLGVYADPDAAAADCSALRRHAQRDLPCSFAADNRYLSFCYDDASSLPFDSIRPSGLLLAASACCAAAQLVCSVSRAWRR